MAMKIMDVLLVKMKKMPLFFFKTYCSKIQIINSSTVIGALNTGVGERYTACGVPSFSSPEVDKKE